MAYQPFQRSYRGGGGAGFGGNAWVSLMGGAAQGLLGAQKQRAEMVKQAQEEALRRAANERANKSSAREQEKLEMARKEQEAASKKRMTDEETRLKEVRKAREDEAAARQRETGLYEGYLERGLNKRFSDEELKRAARGVEAGDMKIDWFVPPKEPKTEKLTYERMTESSRRQGALSLISQYESQNAGGEVGAGGMGPPTPGPDHQKFLQDLGQAIQHHRQQLASVPKGSDEWWQISQQLEVEEEAQEELMYRLRIGQRGSNGGDFAAGAGGAFAGVNTDPGR